MSGLLGVRLRELVVVGIGAVEPAALVRAAVHRQGDGLLVDGVRYQLSHNVHVLGAGKAVLAMLPAVEQLLEGQLVAGVLSVPAGSVSDYTPRVIQVRPGATNNLPDSAADRTVALVSRHASRLTAADLLLVLLSGGGSALLPAPRPPITLEIKRDVIQRLAARGASIQQLNCVRGALSELKAGGLARLAWPARVLTLILSDVVGDTMSVIASGPTCRSNPAQLAERAIEVLQRFKISCPEAEMALKSVAQLPDEPMETAGHIHNVLIGNNAVALEAMRRHAGQWYKSVTVLSDSVEADADQLAAALVELAAWLLASCPGRPPEQLLQMGVTPERLGALRVDGAPVCVLMGGESTVRVRGAGRGGRCQQMALRAAVEFHSRRVSGDVMLIVCGTDGADGPTDAAGAICDPTLVKRALQQALDPWRHLDDNDSYSFFSSLESGRWQVKTGLSGTNVMDVIAMIVEPQPHNPAILSDR